MVDQAATKKDEPELKVTDGGSSSTKPAAHVNVKTNGKYSLLIGLNKSLLISDWLMQVFFTR